MRRTVSTCPGGQQLTAVLSGCRIGRALSWIPDTSMRFLSQRKIADPSSLFWRARAREGQAWGFSKRVASFGIPSPAEKGRDPWSSNYTVKQSTSLLLCWFWSTQQHNDPENLAVMAPQLYIRHHWIFVPLVLLLQRSTYRYVLDVPKSDSSVFCFARALHFAQALSECEAKTRSELPPVRRSGLTSMRMYDSVSKQWRRTVDILSTWELPWEG